MNGIRCQNLPGMFFSVARNREAQPFLWAKRKHQYEPMNWSKAAGLVLRLAHGLTEIGIETGDRVVLVSENRPEWVIADLAIMSAVAITVPGYITNTVEQHRHILSNSGAKIAIVSEGPVGERLILAAREVLNVKAVISMGATADTSAMFSMHAWDDLLASEGGGEIDRRLAAVALDDTACIIYTSGTSGAPKGVILSHRNIIANCYGAYRLLADLGLDNEVFLNFLPLSHAYEHTAGLMFPIYIGAQIYFAEGVETLPRNLMEARPTMMTAVPRLYETMYQRIRLGVEREGMMARCLFERAVAVGHKRLHGKPLTLGERLMDPVIENLVRKKIRARFGGRLKTTISGGAPLNPEIGAMFVALGLQLLQGYGQTEASPVITCNPPGHIRIDSVGLPVSGVRIRIADDGEILVAGENVMRGYWKDPEATAHTLVDGWLHTGDVGWLDPDGYLRITDRKRDFIKNSGGEVISPARVEAALTLAPEIAQAMVFGDQRPYLVGVLVPDWEFIASQTDRRDPTAPERHDEAQKIISDAVARVNQGLSAAERIRRFVIASEPFSVDNGQLTPTLKIRRDVIREGYESAIDMLYRGRAGVHLNRQGERPVPAPGNSM